MVMEMNLLSLNSDGAFRTMMQRRMPHSRNRNSTEGRERQIYYSDGRTTYTTTAHLHVPSIRKRGAGNGGAAITGANAFLMETQSDRHIT